MQRRSLVAIFVFAVATGCNGRPAYDARHPSRQLRRTVLVRGTFEGPGVEADYVTTAGRPVYLSHEFFKTIPRPAYGSDVEVSGILRLKAYPPGDYQHTPDYYYIDCGSLHVLRSPG